MIGGLADGPIIGCEVHLHLIVVLSNNTRHPRPIRTR